MIGGCVLFPSSFSVWRELVCSPFGNEVTVRFGQPSFTLDSGIIVSRYAQHATRFDDLQVQMDYNVNMKDGNFGWDEI